MVTGCLRVCRPRPSSYHRGETCRLSCGKSRADRPLRELLERLWPIAGLARQRLCSAPVTNRSLHFLTPRPTVSAFASQRRVQGRNGSQAFA